MGLGHETCVAVFIVAFVTIFPDIVAAFSMKSMIFSVRQSINAVAFRKSIASILTPHLILPQISVNSIEDIDANKLLNLGIKCIVFDKDNTLSYTYDDNLHPSVKSKLNYMKEIFPGKIAILSNSVGSCDDDKYEGAEQTENSIGLPVIRHQLKKPACLDEVISHFRSSARTSIEPQEICVIGDRVLTDVVFANMHGMVSVLVAPLSVVKDHPVAAVIRIFERNILLPLLHLFGFKPRPLRNVKK